MAVGWIPKSLPGSCKLILSEESEEEELDTKTYNCRAVRIRGARLAICIWSVSRNCESALFLEPKITSSLCDAVGSEDEKQTRTLTNGKDRHHN